jgi:hypothetical protein
VTEFVSSFAQCGTKGLINYFSHRLLIVAVTQWLSEHDVPTEKKHLWFGGSLLSFLLKSPRNRVTSALDQTLSSPKICISTISSVPKVFWLAA